MGGMAKTPKTADSPPRAILYARVSTAEQAASGLGLEAQLTRTRAHAEANGYQVVAVRQENGASGMIAPDQRPELGAALADLAAGSADILVAAALSRLGRNTADVLALVDRAEREGWGLAVLDLGLDTRQPVGRLVLTMLAGIARFERDQTAQRTRDALAAKKARGARLGAPVRVPAETRARALSLRDQGLTLAKVAETLNRDGFRAANGGRIHPTTVSRILRSAALDQEAAANRERAA